MAPKQSQKTSKTRKLIEQEFESNELANLKQAQTRARSFTVGATTGGIIEVAMRGDFSNLWYLLKPVEAAEIIEQLAAAAGLEVAMRPKQNFTAWRSWDSQMPEFSDWKGSAPWQLDENQRNALSAYDTKLLTPIAPKEIKKLEAPDENKEETKESVDNTDERAGGRGGRNIRKEEVTNESE